MCLVCRPARPSCVPAVRAFACCSLALVLRHFPSTRAGGALAQVLRATPLPPGVIVDWALQIARGMRYIHHDAALCIVHRDLKPCNVLLSQVGLACV